MYGIDVTLLISQVDESDVRGKVMIGLQYMGTILIPMKRYKYIYLMI